MEIFEIFTFLRGIGYNFTEGGREGGMQGGMERGRGARKGGWEGSSD